MRACGFPLSSHDLLVSPAGFSTPPYCWPLMLPRVLLRATSSFPSMLKPPPYSFWTGDLQLSSSSTASPEHQATPAVVLQHLHPDPLSQLTSACPVGNHHSLHQPLPLSLNSRVLALAPPSPARHHPSCVLLPVWFRHPHISPFSLLHSTSVSGSDFFRDISHIPRPP